MVDDIGVVEAMLEKYMEMTVDLTPWECKHFTDWCHTYNHFNMKSDLSDVELGELTQQ